MEKSISYNELLQKLSAQNEESEKFVKETTQLSDIIFKLVTRRNDSGLSQRKLAELIGMKQPALARIERLAVIPKIDTLIKIATALNCKIDLLPDKGQSDQPISYIYIIPQLSETEISYEL